MSSIRPSIPPCLCCVLQVRQQLEVDAVDEVQAKVKQVRYANAHTVARLLDSVMTVSLEPNFT